MPDSKNVFITGVSSGIGHALAREYLDRGCRVFGVSRRRPTDLIEREGLTFESLDLNDHAKIEPTLSTLLDGVDRLHTVVLNAGMLGAFGDLGEIPLDELRQVFETNVWVNKTVLDSLFSQGMRIDQVVAVSSGASVNGNRGWAGYSISKAALNMLIRLYARERPDTHFCALAPGVLRTSMLDKLLSRPPDERYPSIENLRAKNDASQITDPEAAAGKLIEAFGRLPGLIESGEYADVRMLPQPG
jgi:benzil reductase ((S)-benzoin forming)